MIPSITEIGFPSYATLHQATVSFEEMGSRTITTQVRIDGDVVPDFSGWKLMFRGETFVLPTLKPNALKDNSTRNSLIDLVFESASISELKRYFFAEMTEVEQGTIIIDKYVASLRVSLTNFVAAFNKVLAYYFPNGDFVMNLNPSYPDDGTVKDFQIDYMYIWDVLLKMNEVYGVTWRSVTTTQDEHDVTVIRVGYDMGSIPWTDHLFQYGFEGGLLRIERHVEETDIYNVLLGRGGEKNIPARYFKYTDPYNTAWAADPDAIQELKTVYFSRLLDSNFRSYVQGWKTNSNRTLGPGESVEAYDSSRGATDWAYAKGHTDEKFDPVEYVKDDDSISLYGVRQGKLDDNDDIYPTIQGIWLDYIGRADEVVAVEVTAEDDPEAVYDIVTDLNDILSSDMSGGTTYRARVMSNQTFTIEDGRVGRMEYAWLEDDSTGGVAPNGLISVADSNVIVKDGSTEYGPSVFPAGEYSFGADLVVNIVTGDGLAGRYGIQNVKVHSTPDSGLSYRQIFTIWIKDIWEEEQGVSESDLEYAHRVWDPILGDKLGNSAAVHFSTGFMSVSEDYEFLIQKLPEVDRTKTLVTTDRNGGTITVNSEWKITLVRSDAEYEATGKYIPNTETGGLPAAKDFFFFTGIDVPFQYVKWAEDKLHDYKQDALDENAWTNPTWIVSLDKIRAHTKIDDYGKSLADKIDAGVKVTITDPRFTRNSQNEQTKITLCVRNVTFTWNEPSVGSPYIVPDIDVVLSEKIVNEESYDDVKSSVTYIQNNYTTVNQAKTIAKRTKSQGEFELDDDICYLGPIIGTVEE